MQKATLLLVDDQVETLRLFRNLFTSSGYDIITASNSEEVFSIVRSQVIDLILLDIMMPEMNGFEICSKLKENEASKDIPVIFLTALDQRRDIVRGLKTGAVDYIKKPFDLEEVVARINVHIELRKSRQTILKLNSELSRKNVDYEREIKQATSFISSILPLHLDKPCSIDWRFIPSLQLGGDTFNYFFIDNELVIYLLDVSGHGLVAALLSISITNIIRSQALPGVDFQSPAAVLAELNQKFKMEENGGNYFTIWYGIINFESRTIRYSAAGHPAPLLVHGSKNEAGIEQLKGEGLPIGFFTQTKYKEMQIGFREKDQLILFSDGTFDYPPVDGKIFGYESFNELILEEYKRNGINLDSLMQSLYGFNGSENFTDDFSLIKITF